MLIEFSVKNYLSFKDTVVFSMVAAPIKELNETNTFQVGNLTLLKSSVIYGANASGKSNLFSAMGFMRDFTLNSSKETQAEEEIPVENFKLNTESEKMPSEFEVIFLYQDYKYRYGFEVDEEKVHSEWLFRSKGTGKEANLFFRVKNDIKVGAYFKEGRGLEERTRDNALFLSVVGQFNGDISKKVLNWFNNFNVMFNINRTSLGYTKRKLDNPNFKKAVLDLMKVADLSIDDISIEEIDVDEIIFPDDMPISLKKLISQDLQIVITHHKKYDENNNVIEMESFILEKNESQGTIKFFALAAPILDALMNGRVLVIDELDSKLHPLLTRAIINLFNSKENNSNAQIIFATHDTNHLNKKLFRRDQIWFVEKDRYGCSDLYSLVEYKLNDEKVRNDASYEKDYISGKYGAIPYIGRMEFLEE